MNQESVTKLSLAGHSHPVRAVLHGRPFPRDQNHAALRGAATEDRPYRTSTLPLHPLVIFPVPLRTQKWPGEPLLPDALSGPGA